jgi:hypothetical protein
MATHGHACSRILECLLPATRRRLDDQIDQNQRVRDAQPGPLWGGKNPSRVVRFRVPSPRHRRWQIHWQNPPERSPINLIIRSTDQTNNQPHKFIPLVGIIDEPLRTVRTGTVSGIEPLRLCLREFPRPRYQSVYYVGSLSLRERSWTTIGFACISQAPDTTL